MKNFYIDKVFLFIHPQIHLHTLKENVTIYHPRKCLRGPELDREVLETLWMC